MERMLEYFFVVDALTPLQHIDDQPGDLRFHQLLSAGVAQQAVVSAFFDELGGGSTEDIVNVKHSIAAAVIASAHLSNQLEKCTAQMGDRLLFDALPTAAGTVVAGLLA